MSEPSPKAKQAAEEYRGITGGMLEGEKHWFCRGYDAALRAVGSTEQEQLAKLQRDYEERDKGA